MSVVIKVCNGNNTWIVFTCLEYAILEIKLLSTEIVLYRAFLHCSFTAAEALRFRSLSVRLTASAAAASLNTFDVSVHTAFFHIDGPHLATSLHRRPAPAHDLD